MLCSAHQSSTILVFWNGSETNPGQIETRNDQDSVQGWTDNKMAYSRRIAPIDNPQILEYYKAFGGEKPPVMDHQGVDDAFVGKASTVFYFQGGKWHRLSGAD